MSPDDTVSRWQGFAVRVATALVIGAVMLASLLWGGGIVWAALVALIAVACSTEYRAIVTDDERHPNAIIGTIAAAALPLAALGGSRVLLLALVAVTLAVLVRHVAVAGRALVNTSFDLLGMLYTGLTLAHLVLMRELTHGMIFVFGAIVSVWADDVLAYLVGTSIGRHKMAPRLSPQKSWEGLAAGSVGAVAVWLAVWRWGGAGLSLPWAVVVGLGAAGAVVTGDLFESRLKREANLKDSGRFLPGHGGFLDRFDSLIFVSVVTYWLLALAGAR
jgi:phosphatidate cytidylyltransferase